MLIFCWIRNKNSGSGKSSGSTTLHLGVINLWPERIFIAKTNNGEPPEIPDLYLILLIGLSPLPYVCLLLFVSESFFLHVFHVSTIYNLPKGYAGTEAGRGATAATQQRYEGRSLLKPYLWEKRYLVWKSGVALKYLIRVLNG